MDEWSRTIVLYREELLKEQKTQMKEKRRLHQRIHGIKITKSILIKHLNEELAKLKSELNECVQKIQTHKTLISETLDGTLDQPYRSDSE